MVDPSAVSQRLPRLVGALFLIAMAAAMASNALLLPVFTAEELLEAAFAGGGMLRTAAILMIVNCIAIVAIGAGLYEVLARRNVFIALSYLSVRVVESGLLLAGIISVLALPGLGAQYEEAAGDGIAHLQAAAKAAINQNWYAYHVAMIWLGLGSLLLCNVLYAQRLVPRLLSVLGFLGYAILAIASILAILDLDVGLIATLPVFVFEVVLGFWLLAKGFARPAGDSAG